MKKGVKLKVILDDSIPAFAGFLAGTGKEKKPIVLFNLYASIHVSLEHKDINLKEMVIENLMHEFGHYLEEIFDKQFDEKFIEKCIKKYKEL